MELIGFIWLWTGTSGSVVCHSNEPLGSVICGVFLD